VTDALADCEFDGGDVAGWLRWALRRVHPGHAWIEVLDRARAGQQS
jgi:hypothetical protein